jgi:HK97 family phage portal protein
MKFLGFDITRGEKRGDNPLENPSVPLNDAGAWEDLLGGFGMPIGTTSALGLASVYRCVDLISGWVAVLPKSVYRKTDGKREKLGSHIVTTLINNPCEYLNRIQFEKQLFVFTLLWGNAYARIWRNGNYEPVVLELIHPNLVDPFVSRGKKYYRIASTGEVLSHFDMLHVYDLSVDGVKGKSKITIHRENLQLTQNAQAFGADFFKKGTTSDGYLKFTQNLNEDQIKLLKKSWISSATGRQNNHGTSIVPFGGEFVKLNMPMEDAQFIQTRQFQKGEIATIFGVPPHLVNDMDNAKYNNVEQLNTAFYQNTLLPWISLLEMEYSNKLLTEKGKQGGEYVKASVKSMLRGDITAQTTHYKEMILMGVYSPNVVLELEDMDGFEGGDERYRPLNMVAINEETNKYIPNQKVAPEDKTKLE